MRSTLPSLLLILGLAPGLAMAEPGEDYWKRSGWYLGITGLYGTDLFEDQLEVALRGLDADVKDTGGLNAYGGYRVTSWFAAEANYEWMDNFKTETVLGDLDYTTHSFTANAKFILPFWRVQPYLNLGVGGQYFDLGIPGGGGDTGWGFVGRPGAGIDFFLTEHLVLNAQVNGMLATSDPSTIGSNVNDLFYLSVGGGLQYRF